MRSLLGLQLTRAKKSEWERMNRTKRVIVNEADTCSNRTQQKAGADGELWAVDDIYEDRIPFSWPLAALQVSMTQGCKHH